MSDLLAKWRADLGRVLGEELVIELRRHGAGELITLLDHADAVERVRDLHQETGICIGSTETYCNEDGMPWPCTTIRALEGASDD